MSFVLTFTLYVGLEVRFFLREKQADNTPAVTTSALYYYNFLTHKEQLLYDTMLECVNHCLDKTQSLPYLYDDAEYARALEALVNDHPQLFYLDIEQTKLHRTYHHSYVAAEYIGSAASIDAMNAQLHSAMDIALASIPDISDAREIQLALHDYLLTHCSYATKDAASLSHTAYGALVEGKAQANGYAAAYQLLLEQFNIPSIVVHGTANGVSHTWNMVDNDGIYSHVDIAWNDADLEFAPQLRFHGYYQLTDAEIFQDHQPNQPDILPDTNGAMNYYRQNDLVVESKIDMDHILYREILTAGYAKREFVEFYLEAPEPFELADVHLYEDVILDVIRRINGLQNDFQFMEVYRPYQAANGSHGITLQLFYLK